MNTENNNVQDNVIDGAITEVKAADPALAVLNPTQYAAEVFQPFEDRLVALRRTAGRIKYDIKTKDGMAKAKELRAAAVKIRTEADKAKTLAKRPIDESGKLILAHFKKIEESAKAEESKHDAVITAEEARIEAEKQRKLAEERARIEAIESRIAHIRGLAAQLAQADSATLAAKVEELATKRLDPALYDDHLEDAVTALNTAVDDLRALHEKALAREAEQRRIAEERAELERLRAEQAERDRVAAEQKRIADEQAAEQQRQMDEMRRSQERSQRIMEDIQNIQQLGLRDGDAAAVLANLQYAESIEITDERFGGMASMAQMAKDMAVSSLKSKHTTALAEEQTRLANIAAAQPVIAPVELDGTGVIIGAVLVSAGEPVDEVEIVQSPVKEAPEDSTRVTRAARNVPPVLRPTDDEIMDVLMAYFGKSRGMIANWLMRMDAGRLLAIAEESGE